MKLKLKLSQKRAKELGSIDIEVKRAQLEQFCSNVLPSSSSCFVSDRYTRSSGSIRYAPLSQSILPTDFLCFLFLDWDLDMPNT